MPENDELMYFNGINAVTGAYTLQPMSAAAFTKSVLGAPSDDPDDQSLSSWYQQSAQDHYGLKTGFDYNKLSEAGWGVVFPVDVDPRIVDALRPLLDWRKSQAGNVYKEYSGGLGGVRPKDNKSTWLARQGAENFGPVDPTNVPYYLMLVGGPEGIDYRFQYLLDVQYGVGRVAFDTPEEYAYYAQSVVQAEKEQLALARQITFFGVANRDDGATQMSASRLVQPLADYVTDWRLQAVEPWQAQAVVAEKATKQRLSALLGGGETPALLLTASHGMAFPNEPGYQEQMLRHQGALLCQDWKGPKDHVGEITEKLYFSADDIGEDARLWGTVAFFFACYGAGTPLYDEFTRQARKTSRETIAPRPFISRLPQRMLAHPKGGALAVIGHVERAWGYSFVSGQGKSLTAFESTLDSLMRGDPIGYAFEVFNERYAEFSTDLTAALDEAQWTSPDPVQIASKWTANNDAKNYVVLGDPAVRVRAQPKHSAKRVERPVIQLSSPAKGKTAFAVPASTEAPASTEPSASTEAPVSTEASASTEAPALAEAPKTNGGSPHAALAEVPGPASTADDLNYGALDVFKQGASNVGDSVKQFVQKLSAVLTTAVENAATLEVCTYTSTNLDQVKIQGGAVSGARLRALTYIGIDGDTKVVVPEDADGTVDRELWDLHVEMVKQAQDSRAELIKSAVSAVANLAHLGGASQ